MTFGPCQRLKPDKRKQSNNKHHCKTNRSSISAFKIEKRYFCTGVFFAEGTTSACLMSYLPNVFRLLAYFLTIKPKSQNPYFPGDAFMT